MDDELLKELGLTEEELKSAKKLALKDIKDEYYFGKSRSKVSNKTRKYISRSNKELES